MLKWAIFSLIHFSMVTSTAMETSPVPLTIKEKIATSDAIVLGQVANILSKRDVSKNITTEVSLRIKKGVGITFNESISRNNFKIRYLGGKWQNQSQQLPKHLDFKKGEEVIVFLKKKGSTFWPHHLAAGKFSRATQGKSDLFISKLHSDREGVGRISLWQLERLLQASHFQKGLSYIPRENRPIIPHGQRKNGRFRSLASITSSGLNGQYTKSINPQANNASHIKTVNLVFSAIVIIFIGGIAYFFIFGRGQGREKF